MQWVVDCSFAAALFLPDEQSDKVERFFLSLNENDNLVVPLLWWYELTNIVLTAERRKRLMSADVETIFSTVDRFKFITDQSYGPVYRRELYRIGREFSLSAYDAAYLELAIRTDSSLATLDASVHEAARASGIQVYSL